MTEPAKSNSFLARRPFSMEALISNSPHSRKSPTLFSYPSMDMDKTHLLSATTMNSMTRMKIFSGNSNMDFARKVAQAAGVELGPL